jgi:hypothetical protein
MADRLDLQLISAALRRVGWARFWIQLVLAVVVVGVLLFNNIGGQLAGRSDRALGLGPGLSMTRALAFVVLLWSLWQSWLEVRCGRALNSAARPSKGETAKLIKRGLFADLVGLSLASVAIKPWPAACLCRPRCRRLASSAARWACRAAAAPT